MESKDKNMPGETKRSTFSVVLYVAASIAALVGVALLVNNVLLYKNNIAQYVAQGYPADIVAKQLIPAQLLPGVFEPIGVYGGVAFILFGIGVVNNKVSKYIMMQDNSNVCNETLEEVIGEQNAAGESIEADQQTEAVEQEAPEENTANVENAETQE